MAIIRPKSAEQQRKQGWLIVAVGLGLVIAQATGLLAWLVSGY